MSTNSAALAVMTDPGALKERMQYAQALAASNLIPKHFQGQPANVLIAVEYGKALGIDTIIAINGIAVINGKPSMSSDLMSSMVRRAGHKLRITEDTENKSVTAILIRADDPDHEFKATWDEAKARDAGLWGKRDRNGAPTPWVLYPLQMLRARAISEVCRQGASDALSGVIYTPEELGAAVDEDEHVIHAQVVEDTAKPDFPRAVTSPPQRRKQPQPEPAATTQQVETLHAWQTRLQITGDQLDATVEYVTGRDVRVEELTRREAEAVSEYLRTRWEERQHAEAEHVARAAAGGEHVVDGELVEEDQQQLEVEVEA